MAAVANDGPQIAEDLLETQDIIITNVGVTTTPHTNREIKFTGLAQERYQKLLNEVERKGFMLKASLHSYFMVRLQSTRATFRVEPPCGTSPPSLEMACCGSLQSGILPSQTRGSA